MLYRRKTYKINPEMYKTFTHFIHTYLLPNQLTHDSQLVGRWVNEEQTGIHTEIGDMIGAYQNITMGIICFVFRGRAISGAAAAQPPETIDVQFVDLEKECVEDWMKRPQFMSRVNDALNKGEVAYESYEVRPYRLVERT